MALQDLTALDAFIPPSVTSHHQKLCHGLSYSHYSQIPTKIQGNTRSADQASTQAGTPCVLGVDEAGRGPVIGPMVYGVFYLPIDLQYSLLANTHHFDDSKVLTPAVRANLMQKICTPGCDLYQSCGWAIKSLSAQDIGAGMLGHGGSYNLNAQAMDATVEIIRGVIDSGVNVREIYVDTIGIPAVYQKKLERIFPTIRITVEKKADSLYPCVSAASVVAKVTRDASCEKLYENYADQGNVDNGALGWGSGYPSDGKCVSWLKSSIDPVFGWGNEGRFSWGTLKDLLEIKGGRAKIVDWPDSADDDNMKMSRFFAAAANSKSETGELREWFGTSVGEEAF